MDDLISRQAAIEAIHEDADWLAAQGSDWQVERMERDKSILKSLPSAEPDTDEWCTDCKEYDKVNHCCPRWNRVIREALKDAQIEKRTEKRTGTHACDCISRHAAIETAKNVAYAVDEHGSAEGWLAMLVNSLEMLLSAQPEIIRCKECLMHGVCRFEQGLGLDGYCSQAERRTDE